jgi:hypothetical protein
MPLFSPIYLRVVEVMSFKPAYCYCLAIDTESFKLVIKSYCSADLSLILKLLFYFSFSSFGLEIFYRGSLSYPLYIQSILSSIKSVGGRVESCEFLSDLERFLSRNI